jgi:hypothetical protein
MFYIFAILCKIQKDRPFILVMSDGTINSLNFGLAKTIRAVMGHVKVALRNVLEDIQGF